MPAAKAGFLMPKKVWDFAPRAQWPNYWLGSLTFEKADTNAIHNMSLFRAWLPYLLVAIILVLSRVSSDFKDLLKSISFGVSNILGEIGISASVQPLYLRWYFVSSCIHDTVFTQYESKTGCKCSQASKSHLSRSRICFSFHYSYGKNFN